VDEERSLKICQQVVASSTTNKLFIVTNQGKIQVANEETEQSKEQNSDQENQVQQPSAAGEAGDALSILAHSALLPRDVQIIPVTNNTAVNEQKDQQQTCPKKQQQQQSVGKNDKTPQSGITVQTLINGFIHEQLLLSNNNNEETAKTSNSFIPTQNILQNILTNSSRGNQGRSTSTDASVMPGLPYKLPVGITITPYTDDDNKTTVIQKTDTANDTMAATLPVHSKDQRIHDNSGDSDISSGGDCEEVLTRLPPHITIIPLGSTGSVESHEEMAYQSQEYMTQQMEEASPSGRVRSSSQLTPDEGVGDETPEGIMMLPEDGYRGLGTDEDERTAHECGLKALIPCSKCGSFCHSDCVRYESSINGHLCASCFMGFAYPPGMNQQNHGHAVMYGSM